MVGKGTFHYPNLVKTRCGKFYMQIYINIYIYIMYICSGKTIEMNVRIEVIVEVTVGPHR